LLSIDKINVFYNDLQALWEVSLKVEKGKIVLIIGGNGAGKTTTLKAVSGLLPIRSGSITFLGHRIEKFPADRIVQKGLVQIPEGRQLFPYMSVEENLKIGAYTHTAQKKRDENMEWVFRLFPILKERRSQQTVTLSGGEQQMLAIGRGLMAGPALLMMDEPSLGLAPKFVQKMFDVVKQINDQGIAVLLVEQNIHYALKLADRGYVLETGRISLEGEAKQLINNNHVKKAYLGM
jgi:branched-chain amino acid transport system ATP-binding protein